jgi:hypothetical protein
MGWLYLVIIFSSILIGILVKLYVQEMNKVLIIHSILFLISINVFLLIKYEFAHPSWNFEYYFLIFLLPILISFISACILNSIQRYR